MAHGKQERLKLLSFSCPRSDLDVNPDPRKDQVPWLEPALDSKLQILQALLARKEFDPWRWRRRDRVLDYYSRMLRNTDYMTDGIYMATCTAAVKLLEDDKRFRLPKFYAL